MNESKIKMREVLSTDLVKWYHKLGYNPSKDLLKEFDVEVQNWNLYDLTYQVNENEKFRMIRYYGITLPHVLKILIDYFPLNRNFNCKDEMVYDLKIIPHNEDFRSKKLNDGCYKGSSDRTGHYQYYNVRNWGELMGFKEKINS